MLILFAFALFLAIKKATIKAKLLYSATVIFAYSMDAYIKSTNAGNSAVDALKDGRNQAVLAILALSAFFFVCKIAVNLFVRLRNKDTSNSKNGDKGP